RHMAIATITNETIVVPNGMLMQNRVTVVGRRGEERTTWRRYVPFNVEYEIPPARVIAEVERALAHAQIPHVAPQPRPIVGCTGFLDSGIEYTVCYDLTSPAEMWNVDSQIRVHVYAALLRQGLGIPFPRRVVELRRDERPKLAEREIEHRAAALSTIDLFASLTDDERGSLARQLTTSAYVADEILFRAGEPADSLYLLAQGRVDILREGGEGAARHKLAALRAPAYFGEMGLLLGQPRAQTVVAASDVVCYRLDKKGFDAIMQARPELAEILAHVLAERQAANDAALQLLDADTRDRRKVGRTTELMRRIQSFFGLAA
ncbi:MAG: cyclic nucleotide-binding domain-containing protein, partial [Betaproteobacteria bacterium]